MDGFKDVVMPFIIPAMPNIAIFPERTVNIPALSLWVDGYPDYLHKLKGQLSSSPLETGAVVNDHATALPAEMELIGWVADDYHRGEGWSPARAAWRGLRRLNRESIAVSVVTPWDTFDEMIITELNAEQRGQGMRFDLRLSEVQRVGTALSALTNDTVTGPGTGRTSVVERGYVRPISLDFLEGPIDPAATDF